jgi:hypothetical protein
MVDYSRLENYLSDEVECFVFDSIPSTNNYLSSLAFSLKTQVCIAAQQTQGKGQHNRQWLSGRDSIILSTTDSTAELSISTINTKKIGVINNTLSTADSAKKNAKGIKTTLSHTSCLKAASD